MKLKSLVSLSLVLAALPVGAATFSAFNDFSGSNPSGAWSYGTAVNGFADIAVAFTPMASFDGACIGAQAACWSSGSAVIVRPNSTFTDGTVDFMDTYLTLHPSSALDWAVLRFTAPATGNYTYSGQLIDQDTKGGNGVVFRVIAPGQDDSSTLLPTFPIVPVAGAGPLLAGQSVYLMIGANGAYDYDSVGMQVDVRSDVNNNGNTVIPEPATYGLALAGLAGLFLRRRLSA